jgi:hypothetical protein
MLSLDDPRWSELHTHSREADWVPAWLERLRAAPDDLDLFNEGFYGLWSDENTWSAAFAAAPHLMAIAPHAGDRARLEYVAALGTFAAYRERPGSGSEYGACPPDLEAGFGEALQAALVLAGELLPLDWDERETVLLVAAVAAFKGMLGLSRAIEAGGVWCRTCKSVVQTPRYATEASDDAC